METYQSHHTGVSPHNQVTSLYQERVDPYAADTLVAPERQPPHHRRASAASSSSPVGRGNRNSRVPPQQPAVLAPAGLYTPSERASELSQRNASPTSLRPQQQQQQQQQRYEQTPSSRNLGASLRRVVVNDVASPIEAAGSKSRYSRDATPPKRLPLVQVYNPVSLAEPPALSRATRQADSSSTTSSSLRAASSRPSADPGNGGESRSPRAPMRRRNTLVTPVCHLSSSGRPSAANTAAAAQPTPSEEGRDSANAAGLTPAHHPPSKPPSPTPGHTDGAAASRRGSTSSKAKERAEATRKGGTDEDGQQQQQQPPVLDLFSAEEARNPRPAQGPLAVSAKTMHSVKYVAQSAYTQRNPFRVQTFADFAAHPILEPPEHFRKYPEAVGEGVAIGTSSDGSRAMLGEFLINRLVDLTQPMSEGERNDMIELLNNTLETLQAGDWFFKWTRTNNVHRRFFWLNMQRGTLAWSPSPKQSLVWNSELKISEVISIKPDCIRDSSTGRSFYRMFITAADRGVCLATEMPQKFDCWFKALQQLTLPNLSNGVPGIWGRPTSVLANGRRGAVGRWASRYSPLQTIADGTVGNMGGLDIRPGGRVSSSD